MNWAGHHYDDYSDDEKSTYDWRTSVESTQFGTNDDAEANSDFMWKSGNKFKHTIDANGDVVTIHEPENKLILATIPNVTEVLTPLSRSDNIIAPNITDEELNSIATKTKVTMPTYPYNVPLTTWGTQPILNTNGVSTATQSNTDTTTIRLLLRIIQKIDTNHSIVMKQLAKLEERINIIDEKL
jgi:hypothetical protein